MPKLSWRHLLFAAVSFSLGGCFRMEEARRIDTVETIDKDGNIVQTSHWVYSDGDTTTTTQTISPNNDVERRRGPGAPISHFNFNP